MASHPGEHARAPPRRAATALTVLFAPCAGKRGLSREPQVWARIPSPARIASR